MSDNQLCVKDALCLHVQQFSSQLEKPPSGSILIHSAAQRRLSSRCRSHPTDRSCCSLTTQRSGPSVSVGTSIDWKIISLTTRVRPILHYPITPSPASKQEAIHRLLGALSTFHALGSLGNNLINLPPCHITTNCILPVQITNFCDRCLKSLSVVDFLWSRLAVIISQSHADFHHYGDPTGTI